jgi:protein-L-isoaspartate O-methyltransferase
MVVPLGGDGEDQVMTKVVKSNEGEHVCSEHGVFRFVPMLPNKANSV